MEQRGGEDLPPPTAGYAATRRVLEDARCQAAQNAKYDLPCSVAPASRSRDGRDTMLERYVLDPGRRSNGLDLLALDSSTT